MVLKIRINFKKYILLSLPSTAIMVLLLNSWIELILALIAYLFTLINQLMLVYGVTEFLNPSYIDCPKNRPTKKIISVFILKLLILALAFVFCEHFMGKRVIIPIINYAILIFVMFFSIERKVER